MMKKKDFINVVLAALFAFPMSTFACTPSFGPADDDDDDDYDDAPILVHGPHRAPQNKLLVDAEFFEECETLEITISKTLPKVSVVICKNGVGVMNCYLGDTVAGSDYAIPLDNDTDTTGMVLYIVSAGKVCSVISLD